MKIKITPTNVETRLLKCIKSYVETDGYEESEETQFNSGELHLGCSIHCSREHYEPTLLMVLDDEGILIASNSKELTPDAIVGNDQLELVCHEYNNTGKLPSQIKITQLLKNGSYGS